MREPRLLPPDEEMTPVATCSECNSPIYEEDIVYVIDDDIICEHCMDKNRKYAWRGMT